MRTPATAGAPDRVGRWLAEQLDPLLEGELLDRAVMLTTLVARSSLRHRTRITAPPLVTTVTFALQALRVEVRLEGALAGAAERVRGVHVPDPILAGLASRWGSEGADQRTMWFELLFGDAATRAA